MKKSKKIIVLIAIVSLLVFSLFLGVACSSNSPNIPSNEQDSGGYYTEDGLDIPEIKFNLTNRKIVYTVDVSISVKNYDKAIQDIYNAVYKDIDDKNWVSSDSQYAHSSTYRTGYLTIRIKSDKLNDFLKTIKDLGSVENYDLSTKDITDSYATAEAHKSALEDTKQYYETLRDSLDIGSLTVEKYYSLLNELTDKITNLNTELRLINDEIIKYDSDIEYSTINIKISYQKVSTPTKRSFGKWIKDAFFNSINFVWNALKYIFIALIYIIPSGIIVAGIAVGVIFIRKKIKVLKSQSSTKKSNDKIDTNKKDL